MKVDPATLSADAAYFWQAATILPRPIAWTATLNEDGSANLAPFSFFTGVSSDPPTCLICVSRRRKQPDGDRPPKDTWRNIERTGEYVIHVVSDALAQQMNATVARASLRHGRVRRGGPDARSRATRSRRPGSSRRRWPWSAGSSASSRSGAPGPR